MDASLKVRQIEEDLAAGIVPETEDFLEVCELLARKSSQHDRLCGLMHSLNKMQHDKRESFKEFIHGVTRDVRWVEIHRALDATRQWGVL